MENRLMKHVMARLALGFVLAGASAVPAHSEDAGTATCGSQTFRDQCQVTWSFSRPSSAFYWVQRLNPMSGAWESLGHDADHDADGTKAQGSRKEAVEPGYLYRVLRCDDARATINCAGSTMVWAPFIQPPEQVDLIPSVVPDLRPEVKQFKGCGVLKNAPWLVQVTQYNVCQLVNAISYANLAELPDMTPPANILDMPPEQVTEIDTVQFNVWDTFMAERGTPIEGESPSSVPVERPPHEHSERHSQ
jgi:hypothetical protein